MSATLRDPKLVFLLCGIAIFLVFLPEWLSFFELWYAGTIYGHGFLVLAASGYLLFQVRHHLLNLQIRPSRLGLFALLSLCSIMLFAKTADIKTLRLLTLPLLIIGWGWAIWGRNFLKLGAIPIGLLIFATPIWDDMSPVFQAITVFVNSILLDLVGIPADIHELYITIPAGTFFVAGGCSGVRYLMVGLFLAPFYGFLYFPGYGRSLALLGLAALLSMLANWVRVFGIIVIGHMTDMQSSIIEDHEAFGWLTFLVFCLIPLFFIARRLEPNAPSPTELERMESGAEQAATDSKSTSAYYRPIALASVLVLLVPVIFFSQTVLFEDSNDNWSPGLPVASGQWRGPLRFANIWEPSFVNPDISEAGTYVSEQLQRVQFQIEAYRQQKQGKELIYYKNNLYDEAEWSLLNHSVVSAPRQNGFGIDRVKETQLVSLEDGRSVLLWSWYRLGDLASASRIEIKLYGGLRGLSGRSNGSFLAIAAECEGRESPDCTEARQSLIRFMSETEYSQ